MVSSACHDRTIAIETTDRATKSWLEKRVGGTHKVTVTLECKCYEATPVDIKAVNAFDGFLDDVGANKGVIVNNSL